MFSTIPLLCSITEINQRESLAYLGFKKGTSAISLGILSNRKVYAHTSYYNSFFSRWFHCFSTLVDFMAREKFAVLLSSNDKRVHFLIP